MVASQLEDRHQIHTRSRYASQNLMRMPIPYPVGGHREIPVTRIRAIGMSSWKSWMQHDESVNFGQGNLSKNAFQELGLWAGNLIHHKFSELAYNLGPSWKLPVLTKTSSALLGTCAVARLCLGLSLVTANRRPALHLLISASSVSRGISS